MLAMVFLMQPLGQFFAALIGLFALLAVKHRLYGAVDNNDKKVAIDIIWRWVIGIGSLPAAAAIAFRFRITDPGRYTVDVKDNRGRAVEETDRYAQVIELRNINVVPQDTPPQDTEPVGTRPQETRSLETRLQETRLQETRPQEHLEDAQAQSRVDIQAQDNDTPGRQVEQDGARVEAPSETEEPLPKQFSKDDMIEYFVTEGNWRLLAGTAICWFLLDFAFSGLEVNSHMMLAKVWATEPFQSENTTLVDTFPSWNPDPTYLNRDIYQVLFYHFKLFALTVSIVSITGSLVRLFFH